MKNRLFCKNIAIFSLVTLLVCFASISSSCRKANEDSQEDLNTIEEQILVLGDPFFSPAPENIKLFDCAGLSIATIIYTDQTGIDRQVKVALFEKEAPITCANFILLANSGHYNGTIIHRLVKDFVIQGGGYSTQLLDTGQIEIVAITSVEAIYGEFEDNGHLGNKDILHEPGVLSMARTDVKDSATDQFFICTGKSSHLDGKYAAFGKCIDSLSLYNVIELGKTKSTAVIPGMTDCVYPFILIKSIEVLIAE